MPLLFYIIYPLMEKDRRHSRIKEFSVFEKIKSFPIFKTRKRKIITLLVVIILAFFGWQIFKGNGQQIQYQTAKVERGTIISTVTASGNVTSGNNISITTSATGTVNEIYVKDDDAVNQGDTIATLTLDQSSLQKQAIAWASYLSAQNTLNSAKAKTNSLQSALFKANQTFVNDRGTINPITDDPKYIEERADWLAAEADYKNQQGVISQAQAALSSAWLSYSQTSATVTSPIAGIISDLSFGVGAVIPESNSTTITSSKKIAAIKTEGTPTVSINLSEIDVPKIKLGNKATLTLDAIPGKTFTGRIVSIDTLGVVSSGVTNYPVTIALDTQTSEVFPNMSLTANIIIATKSDILIVPSSAIQTQADQSYVRILKNRMPQEVSVETGISSDTQTEIVSGLKEKEEVITATITLKQNNTQQSSSPFGAGVLRPGGFGGGSRGGR